MTLQSSQRTQILADTFELPSGIPDALRQLGVTVEVLALPIGDYDLGAGSSSNARQWRICI